jgi:flagellar motor switch protein FliN/FliY
MFGEGSLSQDEIEALLSGTEGFSGGLDFGLTKTVDTAEGMLTEMDRINLTELFKTVIQANLNVYRTLTGKEASYTGLVIDTFDKARFANEVTGEVVDAKVMISGNITGEFHFVFPKQSVLMITNPALGDETNTDITELVMTTFSDIVSQVVSNTVAVISENTNKTLAPGVPSVQKVPGASYITFPNVPMVSISYTLSVGSKNGKVYIVFPQSTAKQIVMAYVSRKMPETARGAGKEMEQMGGPSRLAVKPVEFAPLEEVPPEAEGQLSIILDVPVQITVELGRTKMLVKEVLQLGEGSVVELDKLAGEPVDILVNGRLIAKGEVVVIEENFGVRITEIVNNIDRMFKYTEK